MNSYLVWNVYVNLILINHLKILLDFVQIILTGLLKVLDGLKSSSGEQRNCLSQIKQRSWYELLRLRHMDVQIHMFYYTHIYIYIYRGENYFHGDFFTYTLHKEWHLIRGALSLYEFRLLPSFSLFPYA